jgi:hypothetical protein
MSCPCCCTHPARNGNHRVEIGYNVLAFAAAAKLGATIWALRFQRSKSENWAGNLNIPDIRRGPVFASA